MDSTVAYVLVIVLIALIFDFINGFHDSANSIATVVVTRVLSPGVAVFWAAFFNFVAAFVVGTAVAKTMGKGLIAPRHREPRRDARRDCIGAIVWDLITWYLGPAQLVLPRADRRLRRRGHRQGRIRRAHPERLDSTSPASSWCRRCSGC